MADWANKASAMRPSHSIGSRFEVVMVAPVRWRSTMMKMRIHSPHPDYRNLRGPDRLPERRAVRPQAAEE